VKRLLCLAAVLLLAGCVEPEGGGPSSTDSATPGPGGHGGNGFAVQQGTAHGSNHSIDVDVRWRACEAGFCANATARNNGTATVRISSICVSPWTDRMAHDDKPVEHREPQVTCLAYGRTDFVPGAVAYGNFSWDGRLHDEDQAESAPEGSYTWAIVFWWEASDGAEKQEASADIHFVIGET
jgi:hypothetical protein